MATTAGFADAPALWDAFLADAAERLAAARAHLGLDGGAVAIDPAEDAARDEGGPIAAAAGELFALRTGALLLGVDGLAHLAAAVERALDRAATGAAWARIGPPVAAALDAIGVALAELRRADVSGAHVDDERLAAATRELRGEPPSVAPSTVPGATVVAPSSASPSADAGEGAEAWVPQVDDDMVDPFIEEANERLEAMAQKLVHLEQAPHDMELVRDLFRDLHTVKGSSGFVGLRRMNRLAHAAEDLVGQVRDGARAVDRPLVDALLAALDGLRAILERAVARAPIDVPLEPLLARLRAPGAAVAALASEHATDGEAAAAAGGTAHPSTTSAGAHAGDARHTLRVDFDKLDLLLNLVGELVLHRASLRDGVAGFAALGRELDAQLRRARHAFARAGEPTSRAASARWGEARRPLSDEADELDARRTRERAPLITDDMGRGLRIYGELAQDLAAAVARVDHVSTELRQQVMKLRMLPIARVFNKYHRTVRELAHSLAKEVRLEVHGAETELDKVLVEQLDDPLLHLVRNAVDHGCESPADREAAGKPREATLTLAARHQGNSIVISISDDGAGIDPQRLRKRSLEKGLATEVELAAMDDRAVLDIIFRPGFSTAARVSEVSGRGVGMDVVREAVTRLKGTIDIDSTPGLGTTFTLKLPLTLAIIQVLLVRAAGHELAIPLDAVKRTLLVDVAMLRQVHGRPVLSVEEQDVPLIPLALALSLDGQRGDDAQFPVAIVEVMGERFALGCDRLVGKQEIVIKSLGELLEEVPCVAGATLVGDRVVTILDVPQVVQHGVRAFAAPVARTVDGAAGSRARATAATGTRRPRVLIAEDSDLIRESLRRLFESVGYEAVAARDGAEATAIAARDEAGFDAVTTDVMMPNVDGYELTRALRAMPRYRAVPIVMVTARGERIDRVRGFDAGVDEYITKPLDHGEILRAVARHLGRAAHAEAAPAASTASTTTPPSTERA